MALKAYKHLTDGEVKLVEADSAEEAGLVADVVHGASYIQLQNDGTREEVAAAQGDALWEDVTGELGGGSSFAHLTENTELSRIQSDWLIETTSRFRSRDVNSDQYTEYTRFGQQVFTTGPAGAGNHVFETWGNDAAGDYPEFSVDQLGTLVWSLDATAEDASIRGDLVGGKIQLIATVGSTEVVIATEP